MRAARLARPDKEGYGTIFAWYEVLCCIVYRWLLQDFGLLVLLPLSLPDHRIRPLEFFKLEFFLADNPPWFNVSLAAVSC